MPGGYLYFRMNNKLRTGGTEKNTTKKSGNLRAILSSDEDDEVLDSVAFPTLTQEQIEERCRELGSEIEWLLHNSTPILLLKENWKKTAAVRIQSDCGLPYGVGSYASVPAIRNGDASQIAELVSPCFTII